MKYLKLFENIDYFHMGEDEKCKLRKKVKKLLVNCVNWKMIEDIKDMALEYLDEGYSLSIVLYNTESGYARIYPFYSITYNHRKGLNENWEMHVVEKIPPAFANSDRIRYRVYLSPINYSQHSSREANICSRELLGRIKRAYNHEKITLG